jgi:hypothetical protein
MHLDRIWQGRLLRRTRAALGATIGAAMLLLAVGRVIGVGQPMGLQSESSLGVIMRARRGPVAAANPEILSPEIASQEAYGANATTASHRLPTTDGSVSSRVITL